VAREEILGAGYASWAPLEVEMSGPAVAAVAAMTLLGLNASLHAQRPFPPEASVNLQVLPKDTPVPQVIAAMRAMTLGLGVRCQHCHVGVEGQGLDQFDFVSDTVPAKATARAMLRLTRDLNVQLRAALPAAAEVTCYTCHRGARTPVHTPPPPPPPLYR